jgi:hypothetical protein
LQQRGRQRPRRTLLELLLLLLLVQAAPAAAPAAIPAAPAAAATTPPSRLLVLPAHASPATGPASASAAFACNPAPSTASKLATAGQPPASAPPATCISSPCTTSASPAAAAREGSLATGLLLQVLLVELLLRGIKRRRSSILLLHFPAFSPTLTAVCSKNVHTSAASHPGPLCCWLCIWGGTWHTGRRICLQCSWRRVIGCCCCACRIWLAPFQPMVTGSRPRLLLLLLLLLGSGRLPSS